MNRLTNAFPTTCKRRTTSLAIVALAAALLLANCSEDVVYYDGHPDYARFATTFEVVAREFASGKRFAEIDLAPLNDGYWHSACLFGGYSDPVRTMEERGAKVDEADRVRLGREIRSFPVEEYEVLIAFTNDDERARFIHFRHGVGPEGQHYAECVTKPETKVVIAEWSIPGRRTPHPSSD